MQLHSPRRYDVMLYEKNIEEKVAGRMGGARLPTMAKKLRSIHNMAQYDS